MNAHRVRARASTLQRLGRRLLLASIFILLVPVSALAGFFDGLVAYGEAITRARFASLCPWP